GLEAGVTFRVRGPRTAPQTPDVRGAPAKPWRSSITHITREWARAQRAAGSPRPRAKRTARSTAASLIGESAVRRTVNARRGIVVMVSRLTTHVFGTPSSRLSGTSLGIFATRVVSAAA